MAVPYRYENEPLSGSQLNDDLDYFEDNKVQKVDGKELSTNDLTNELKDKLDNITDEANKYIHPETHTMDMIDGLSDKFNTKHSLIDDEHKLPLTLIESGVSIILKDGDGNFPEIDGSRILNVVKPKKELFINTDTTITDVELNNIVTVRNTGTLTTLTLPLSSTVVGSEIIIVNETVNHTKVTSQEGNKINTFNYYALIGTGSSIHLTATSTRWVGTIVGEIYTELYSNL